MTAYFIVRAQLADRSLKKEFDRWYGEEHLPDACKAFDARRAFRGWSDADELVHHAFYEFDTLAAARAIQGSSELKRLVAEFDRVWGNQVIRTRDIIESIQTCGN